MSRQFSAACERNHEPILAVLRAEHDGLRAVLHFEFGENAGDVVAHGLLGEAHLLRLGILPTGTILPPEQRVVRDLARKRMQLVRSRTTHILAVENITVITHWTRSGTDVLLGRQGRQGDRQHDRRSLDPDGCLARSVGVGRAGEKRTVTEFATRPNNCRSGR